MSEAAKILILEDDENLRSVLARVLADEGYDVTAVANGAAAVESATKESYDLMIADIRMEGMDGLEAIEKAQNLQPNIGSLVVSGYASEQDTARAERLQVGGYLTKPFKMLDLLKYVRDQLKDRGLQDKSAQEDQFAKRAFDWALMTLAKTFDESKLHEGSLVLACRRAEAICRHLELPATTTLAARWATIIVGAAELPSIDVPPFLLEPNPQYPELTSLLARVQSEETDEDVAFDVQAVRLSIEFELDAQADDLSEHYEIAVWQAHETVKEQVSAEQTSSAGLLETGTVRKSQSSLMVLAKTFERAGDSENAQAAFSSLSEQSPEARWRLEGLLGLARLSAQSGDKERCRESCMQALKAAKEQGPSCLASAGLEAALWLERIDAPETGKALNLVSKAADQVDQKVAQAILRFAGQRLGGSPPSDADSKTLTSPAAAHDLAKYIPWFLPHLFERAEQGQVPSDLIMHRLANDFSREFLGTFQTGRSSTERRLAVAKSLAQARFLPDSVVTALGDDPDAAIKEIAAQIKAQGAGEASVQLVRIYSFGNLEVISQGESLEEKVWKTRKVKFLFARLASNWGRPFTNSSLIDTFWPKASARTKKNLYWAVTALRKLLRTLAPNLPEPIVREKEALSLHPEFPRWHDLEEFAKASKANLSASESKDYKQCLHQGQLAGRIYRGGYLEGCYYDFAVYKRNELSEQAVDVFSRAAEAALELKQNEEALELAGMAAELAPYRQEAHGLKMRAHIRLGQAAQACRQYNQLERLLKLEFDVEPSIEMLELFHRARLGFADV